MDIYFKMPEYTDCVYEIYPNPDKFNRHYCRVTAGSLVGYSGMKATKIIQLEKEVYNFPLNGPGKGKAVKKIQSKLKYDGLEHITIMEMEDIKIKNPEFLTE